MRRAASSWGRGGRPSGLICLVALALLGFFAAGARAQPFNGYLILDGNNSDYIEIPHSPDLNPTDAITLEGWVRFDALGCVSLIGKNWLDAYWVGHCAGSLRSYTRGSSSAWDGGTFPLDEWTHWAVTWDGQFRRYYLNGSQVSLLVSAAPLTTSADQVRIGSDVEFEFAPMAALDEFRLWNVARTEAEIQSTMNVPIKTPMPGLVAVWSLDGDGSDALGTHHGEVIGDPVFASQYDFAEGATGFFTTALGVFNPSRTRQASVEVTLLPDVGVPIVIPFDLDPLTRTSIDVDAEVGGPTGVAAVVRANGPISAMRQVHWDDSVFGSTLESGAAGSSTAHYFAEGATTIWDLFYPLSNDNDTDAEVTIQYLRLSGAPVVQTVTVPAHTRRTIWANAEPGMEDTQAGAIITADVPIAAERAMYLTGAGGAWRAGAASRGAHALNQRWYFAECATAFFDCFLLLANSDAGAVANVQVVYQLPSGQTMTKTHIVPANARRTILVEADDAALVDTAVAMTVISDVPIVAERAMWWGPNSLSWYESHVALGSTETGTVWGVGEAWSGGPAAEDAFVLVSNTGDDPAQVRLTIVYDDGTNEQKDYTVAANARATFLMGAEFPASDGQRFSVLVESLGGSIAMPLIVEVSRYQSTSGRFANAGGATTATKIE